MSSAQHILAGLGYAPMCASQQRQFRQHVLIGVVAVLMGCWLPLMAHLIAEKNHGSTFGATSAPSQAAGFAPRH